MSEFDAGEVIDGRYLTQSRLGTGGMADVYLAEDQQLERQVALKLLHRRFAEDPGFVERFRREAQSAANLQHPNVVAVYDRGAWDGTYYIAMEYLRGRTLKQVIRTEAPLEPVRAIDITVQILKATRFAHRRGVIHRDLKPHNVMLDEQDHVKVTDFGIARAGASDMTETGSIMGTAQYLSPEQAQGLAVGESSDLYSIGVILYELLTAQVPFDAESAVTIALKHVSVAPTAPTRINAAIPPALEQTVLWAMNKDPADRPQNAEEFIAVLEGVREALASGSAGQVTAGLTVLDAGAVGAGGVGAGALGALLGAPGAEAIVPGPRPRVQLGAHPVADASTALHPITGERPAYVPLGPGLAPPPPPPLPDPAGPGFGARALPWLVALLLVALLGGGAAAYLLTRPHTHAVPVVVGLDQAAATSKLEAAGFTPNVIPLASSAPPLTVIYQSPLGGTQLKAGATVDLTVSSGPGSTTVPPVVALDLSQARAALRSAGLNVSRVVREASDTVPANQATRTVPDAGTTLHTGQGVVLYISSGVAPLSLPTVTGEPLSAAQAALTGFRVKVIGQSTGSAAPGTVLSQSPAGGTNVMPHSPVTLTVARRLPQITVPNVVGETTAAATATLTALGLTVHLTRQTTTVKAQRGTVLSQTPAAAAKVKPGGTVTLVIARYSATSTTTPSTPSPAPGTQTNPGTGTGPSGPSPGAGTGTGTGTSTGTGTGTGTATLGTASPPTSTATSTSTSAQAAPVSPGGAA